MLGTSAGTRAGKGVNLEIHRNTWRYSKLVDDQRAIVLAHRDRLLRTDGELSALGRQCPERMAELTALVSASVLGEAARQIALIHLDRSWADHLAYLAEVREGIHLRVLARGGDPLSEFHKEAIHAFTNLFDDVADRSAAMFRTVPITAAGANLAAAGLKRPTATWTYLVHDNPFGTDIDRAIANVGRWLKRQAGPGRARPFRR